ncbi:MAG: DNA recombination protein RmuC [Pseudomonadota bacterium]|nr:DNA recombination protein RmuC [Pseudomonadota bacterium]
MTFPIELLSTFMVGLGIGILLTILFFYLRRRGVENITTALLDQAEKRNRQETEALVNRLKESFGSLSLEALTRNTGEFLKLANETLSKQVTAGSHELHGKKTLIDETLGAMKTELQQVQSLVNNFEKDRENKFGKLTRQLQITSEQTMKLHKITSQLQSALAGSGSRGQWGERMAEDVLRLAGFLEGVNYLKQKTLTEAATRPDFTFLLPKGLKLNMDVKFPLSNYLKILEAGSEAERQSHRNLFLRDVRQRVKEVTSRNYINPGDNTVDYVLIFIPNEQVYAYIHENDQELLDEALKQKVILCSPVTLYAVLAVIRQAVDNFNLEKTAAQILSRLGAFNKQWSMFMQSFDKLGSRIEETQKEYQKLTTTRKTQLDRQINKIEDLRRQQEISPAAVDDIKPATADNTTTTENG